jgi:hypothetical protein
MWKLEWCDVYRDGGSLGAVLCEGEERIALFLEVVPWDKPPETLQYKGLRGSEGEIPDSRGEKVPVEADAERSWLWQLENNVRTDLAQDGDRTRFYELLSALRNRNRDASAS